MVIFEAAPAAFLTWNDRSIKRRHLMGERGSKKDKNKAEKQKLEQVEKKKEQQKSKQPAKKPV